MKMKHFRLPVRLCAVLLVMAIALLAAGCQATPSDPVTTQAPPSETSQPNEGTTSEKENMDLDMLASEMPDPARGVVFLEGTWYDMGRQYASSAANHVKRTVLQGLATSVAFFGSPEAAWAATQEAYKKYEQYAHEMLDIFQGIADESGFELSEVFITYNTLTPSAISDPSAVEQSCNAAFAWGDATGGDVIAVSNIDRDKDEYYNPVIFMYPNDPKYPEDTHVIVSQKGFLSAGIMNDAGLCIMTTGGQNGQPEDGAGANSSICPFSSPFVLAARCSTADEARELFLEHYLPGVGNLYYIVDADGKGCIIENVNGDYAVREQNRSIEGDRDYMIGNNGFFAPEMYDHNYNDGTYDDCEFRFETVKYFLERDYGKVTADTFREALACNYYADPDTGELGSNIDWANDFTSYYSPENVAPREKTIGRMIMNATTKTFYVINGNENPLLSLVPNTTGTYSRFELGESIADSVDAMARFSYFYIYQAAKDITNSGDSSPERLGYLNKAKELALTASNYVTLVGCQGEAAEIDRELYSKAAANYALAQAYAKMAWNNPYTLFSDYDDGTFAF